jgi:formylglycine-generating enzyme required for sulfatase activity
MRRLLPVCGFAFFVLALLPACYKVHSYEYEMVVWADDDSSLLACSNEWDMVFRGLSPGETENIKTHIEILNLDGSVRKVLGVYPKKTWPDQLTFHCGHTVPLYFMNKAGYVIAGEVQISLTDGTVHPLSVIRSNPNDVGRLLPSPDGALIAVSSFRKEKALTVTFFDARSRALLGGPYELPWSSAKISWTPDGKLMVAQQPGYDPPIFVIASRIYDARAFSAEAYTLALDGRLDPLDGQKRFKPATTSSPVSSTGRFVRISTSSPVAPNGQRIKVHGELRFYDALYPPFGSPVTWWGGAPHVQKMEQALTTINSGAMKRIKGGEFTRGRSPDDSVGTRFAFVKVLPFWLDETEVTVGAYAECVKAQVCTAADSTVTVAKFKLHSIEPLEYLLQQSTFCNQDKPDRLNHPVNCVTWEQAAEYCEAVGKRLPTDEELEWAARGAEKYTDYPWGKAKPGNQLCWSGTGNDRASRGFEGTCPVGSYPRGDSPQGVKDLSGNVAERTSSGGDLINAGTPEYPVYTRGGLYKVRGNSWASTASPYPGAARPGVDRAGPSVEKPSYRSDTLGFRCARDAP